MCGLASSTLVGEGFVALISSHRNQTPTSPEKETDASPSSSLQKLLDQFETIRSLLPTSEVLDTVETGDLKDPFTQGDPYHQLPNTYTLTILAMKNLNAASAKKDPLHETAVYNTAISTLDKALEMLTKGGDPTMIARTTPGADYSRALLRCPAPSSRLVVDGGSGDAGVEGDLSASGTRSNGPDSLGH